MPAASSPSTSPQRRWSVSRPSTTSTPFFRWPTEPAAPSMNPAIRIAGVTKRFRSLQALAGVDLEVAQGEFFGLLGPNGAGKTTLISSLSGLARPDSGTLEVMGHEVVKDYRAARLALGVVPQELVFDPFFSVREMLKIQSGYFEGRS